MTKRQARKWAKQQRKKAKLERLRLRWERRNEKKLSKRHFNFTKHHLTPKSQGGTNGSYNLLLLKWNQHHEQWHRLFGNFTLEQIIECLQRIARLKHRKEAQNG